MTFAAVGTLVHTATVSLTVDPSAVGNFYLIGVISESATVWCTSVSGGNCSWQQLGTAFSGTVNSGITYTVFAGTATATGSATATLGFNGTVPPLRASGQQFSSTTGSWQLDGAQGNLDSAGTADLPSLTPAGAGDLYFSYAWTSSSATAGSTSGYTYQIDGNGNPLVYDAACTSSAQAPVLGSSVPLTGGALLLSEETFISSSDTVSGAASSPSQILVGPPITAPGWAY